jgi:hypothetical protein
MAKPEIALSPEEQYVVFAALCAMVEDIHTVQDQMTEEQWALAQKLLARLTKNVEGDRAASAAS